MEIIDYSGQIICRGCESEANLSKITENILNQLNCFKNLNVSCRQIFIYFAKKKIEIKLTISFYV